MNEENKCTGGIDYKAEYEYLQEMNHKAEAEAEYWKSQCMEAERMRENMKWVLRTIEVIFGREFGA